MTSDELQTTGITNIMVFRQVLLKCGIKNCRVNRMMHNLAVICEESPKLHRIEQKGGCVIYMQKIAGMNYYAVRRENV